MRHLYPETGTLQTGILQIVTAKSASPKTVLSKSPSKPLSSSLPPAKPSSSKLPTELSLPKESCSEIASISIREAVMVGLIGYRPSFHSRS
ncbi:hypothetical protein TWF481_002895 [Arthrobotrys musiformis]|uniref:Uncharacterized protein n=1 Tax=Arthrobotrys musiformis TaxID=47236 RepID=A0AAV9VXP0_9PEZI